jgi:hypothetical protein
MPRAAKLSPPSRKTRRRSVGFHGEDPSSSLFPPVAPTAHGLPALQHHEDEDESDEEEVADLINQLSTDMVRTAPQCLGFFWGSGLVGLGPHGTRY